MTAPAPVFNSTAKSLTVQGTAGSAVTGSGLISQSTVSLGNTEPCTLAGKTYTQHAVTFAGATFISPAGQQFEARTILTGTLKVSATGSGEFTRVRFKK